MKTAGLIMTMAAIISAPAMADHNSNFGDNTGRTVAGVHDNRIDNNLKSSDNASSLAKPSLQVQSQGSLGAFQQAGHPATVTPGSGGKMGPSR